MSEHGPNSRCAIMRNASRADVIVGLTTDQGEYTGATCLSMYCRRYHQDVIVVLDGLSFPCPSGDDVDLSELPFYPSFTPNSMIECPDFNELCSLSSDEGGRRATGDLTCDELDFCNDNGDCYKGNCYCNIGYTGAWAMCREYGLILTNILPTCGVQACFCGVVAGGAMLLQQVVACFYDSVSGGGKLDK